MEELPLSSAVLMDNRAGVEIAKDGDYWIAMRNLIVETASQDKTFEIPSYFGLRILPA